MMLGKTVGVTIGKFMPLHKGHELMIEFGSEMLDKLYVIVSGKLDDEIKLGDRVYWVESFAKSQGLTNVEVIMHTDKSPEPINIDEFGTVLDEDFQQYWKNEFARLVTDMTHFVSSDRYGKKMAELLGIAWLPVDPDRDMVRISGTEIRRDPFNNFEYISDTAKSRFVKKVAIMGPESTGKSTMAKKIANLYGCGLANEWGRTLSESLGNDMGVKDFFDIVNAQEILIDLAIKNTREGLIISDTEAFTTFKYANIYTGHTLEDIYYYAVDQHFDLYIILAPTVKWVDDGTRVVPDQEQREQFFESLVEFCETNNKKYVIIDDDNYEERHANALAVINEMLGI